MDTLKEFQIIPGVGERMAQTLVDLGYREVRELKNEDPQLMYQNLVAVRGHPVDRCVLYVFRCAVYYAGTSVPEPDLLKWWNWKD